VPSLGGAPGDVELAAADRRAVAIAAAEILANEIARHPAGVFGLGWGNTIADMVAQAQDVSAPEAKFVALMGSLTRTSAANPFESVHRLAERAGGEGFFLPAPHMADSLEDRNVLMGQRTVRETLALAARADLCMVGVTEVADTSFLLTERLIAPDEHEEARRAGAVGSFTGLFFDQAGRPVPCALNERRIGVDPEVLRGRRVVAVVSGVEKAAAVRGALEGRFFTGLVLDERLAEHLLGGGS
jgi:DNA-binding transcriptional regulator LsrR (DeoR family)